MTFVDLDALYAGFLDSLEEGIQPVARTLAHRLGLAPVPDVPWSDVFSHEVTLAAPLLVAEAFPRAHAAWVHHACLAHMLAVIEAFGADRIADGQVEAGEDLLDVLRAAREVRDSALCAVGAGGSYSAADGSAREAIAMERAWLANGQPVEPAAYAQVSLGKQAVGFAASLALARRSGATLRQLVALERLLADVWLGLQHHDDVVDWEDDWSNGGAWAVCLAHAARGSDPTEPGELPAVRRLVLRSGVLADLLERARRRFRGAARRAQALGACRLARWAKDREERMLVVSRAEAKSAGYAVRQFRLAPLAAAVLP